MGREGVGEEGRVSKTGQAAHSFNTHASLCGWVHAGSTGGGGPAHQPRPSA